MPTNSLLIENNALQPILKWAGGKEKELNYIIPNVPSFNNYYEPFVGGGSVFAAIKANKYSINDVSSELVSLYRNIASQNRKFYAFVEAIDSTWQNAYDFFCKHECLKIIYLSFRKEEISKEQLRNSIATFCLNNRTDISAIIDHSLKIDQTILLTEFEQNLLRKFSRMKELELKKNILPDNDLNDNIETAIKSAVYMTFRSEYNRRAKENIDDEYYCALFLFIRNYCYSGMFRYNADGEFNVPYGGIAYNRKTMEKKLAYYKSKPLSLKFDKTSIYNLDFEQFLDTVNPTEDDFIFLDPPYDSEFSTYAQNEFTRADQERLSNYLINECKAKWMMIIKYTDFIYGLYDKHGINIKSFDKEYLVSFMNRNDKKATHLIITNY